MGNDKDRVVPKPLRPGAALRFFDILKTCVRPLAQRVFRLFIRARIRQVRAYTLVSLASAEVTISAWLSIICTQRSSAAPAGAMPLHRQLIVQHPGCMIASAPSDMTSRKRQESSTPRSCSLKARQKLFWTGAHSGTKSSVSKTQRCPTGPGGGICSAVRAQACSGHWAGTRFCPPGICQPGHDR